MNIKNKIKIKVNGKKFLIKKHDKFLKRYNWMCVPILPNLDIKNMVNFSYGAGKITKVNDSVFKLGKTKCPVCGNKNLKVTHLNKFVEVSIGKAFIDFEKTAKKRLEGIMSR